MPRKRPLTSHHALEIAIGNAEIANIPVLAPFSFLLHRRRQLITRKAVYQDFFYQAAKLILLLTLARKQNISESVFVRFKFDSNIAGVAHTQIQSKTFFIFSLDERLLTL
jgi:hypothetical protein